MITDLRKIHQQQNHDRGISVPICQCRCVLSIQILFSRSGEKNHHVVLMDCGVQRGFRDGIMSRHSCQKALDCEVCKKALQINQTGRIVQISTSNLTQKSVRQGQCMAWWQLPLSWGVYPIGLRRYACNAASRVQTGPGLDTGYMAECFIGFDLPSFGGFIWILRIPADWHSIIIIITASIWTWLLLRLKYNPSPMLHVAFNFLSFNPKHFELLLF